MKKGFTLIELLAVVLIMGILTAVAVPQYKKSLERSRMTEAVQMLPAIFDARERLFVEHGTTINELQAQGGQTHLLDNFPFTRLDIDVKGRAAGGPSWQWETDNFVYNLFSFDQGNNLTENVSARAKRGYEGLTLYYDGGMWSCCDPQYEAGDDGNRCDDVTILDVTNVFGSAECQN